MSILYEKYLYIQYSTYMLTVMRWWMLIPTLLQSMYCLIDMSCAMLNGKFLLQGIHAHQIAWAYFALARHILLFIKKKKINCSILDRCHFPPLLKICIENDEAVDMLSYYHCAMKQLCIHF